MKKWADYLISKVRYDSENLISIAIRHQDTDLGITSGEPIDRLTIASDIKNGLSYITIYTGKNSWKKGHKIQTFSFAGTPYLRIDKNKVELDYLGDLPELLFVKSDPILEPEPENDQAAPEQIEKLNQLQKQIEELETIPEPEPENDQATPEQIEKLNQLQKQIEELETIPEPEPEPEPENDQATPEQIEKLNQLQKQIEELETIPEPEPEPEPESESHSSSRGLLPKESAEELPQELDLVPEPMTQSKESTLKQLTQLDDLQRQVDKLENMLSNPFLSKSKSAEEFTPEQFFKVNELEKEIKKSKEIETEYDITQTLQKQNKKLDDIEKKLHDLEK